MPLSDPQANPEGQPEASTWCVVGNVVAQQPYGPGGAETREGTKHFSPGTKLYVFPLRFGIYEPKYGQSIQVLGRHRGQPGGLAKMILNVHAVTNWRVHVVYSPLVIRLIREEGYTGEYWPPWTEERARAYVASMLQREQERAGRASDAPAA